MPKQSEQSPSSTSPAKLVLVGVLAVIFVVVLIVQFGGAEGAEQQPDARRPRPPVAGVPAAPPDSGDSAETPAPWPTLDLADLLRYDPFALSTGPIVSKPKPSPEGSDEPRPDGSRAAKASALTDQREDTKLRQAYAALRQQGVSAILGSAESGYVAIIDSKTVSVDDTLQGFSVVSIGPDGVVLKPSPATAADQEPPSEKE